MRYVQCYDDTRCTARDVLPEVYGDTMSSADPEKEYQDWLHRKPMTDAYRDEQRHEREDDKRKEDDDEPVI